jgi:hypothetical protein
MRVGHGVVGHDAFDPVDAECGEVGGGAVQEVSAGAGFLVGVDLGVGQPGVVVDRGVDVFLADAAAGCLFATGVGSLWAVVAVHTPAAAIA